MKMTVSLVGLTYQTCARPLIYTLFVSHCWKVHLHAAPTPPNKKKIISPELEIIGDPKIALAGTATELGGLQLGGTRSRAS